MNLKDEIRRGEGYELEFKLMPNENREKYMKTAVAFANGHGGRILEEQHIGRGKQHIEPEKQHIEPEKQHLEPKELHIDGLNISAPTRKNIMSLYAELKSVSSFGRKDVCRITGLSPRVASTLLSRMLTFKLITSISGHGKGAYRFV